MRIERIVDLSIVVDDATPVFPGDPRPILRPATRIETEGFNVLSLSLGSHSGTHVDAPSHVVPDGAVLEDLELSRFAGPGVVADVTGAAPRSSIGWSDLAPVAERLRPGAILLLRTGWSERYLRSDHYVDHPFLEPDAAERVLGRGVRTIGIDALNPDPTLVNGDGRLPVHDLVLGAGGVLAENLTNLSAIDGEPIVCLFPIRLGGGADGAPCRAVALDVGI
ncbi:MAG TPA: cyclase family protein [Actinomycetota bacterium]|nr:cyclase family protein [Actinomycetota bacterium]